MAAMLLYREHLVRSFELATKRFWDIINVFLTCASFTVGDGFFDKFIQII